MDGALGTAFPSWEVHGLLDAFSLQQMPALMSRHDFQPSSDGETQHGNKRILETHAVYVVIAGATDQLARGLVASEEKVKNTRIYSGAWRNLLGRTSPLGLR